jgi:16S rRNA (guanine527-N7)-methyltransferase
MNPARIAELLVPFLAVPARPNACPSEPSQRPGAEPAVLSPTQLRDISTYIDMLLRWNARVSLTAIRDPEEIVTRHFGESLLAARTLFPEGGGEAAVCPGEGGSPADSQKGHKLSRDRSAHQKGTRAPTSVIRLADLGSGAGFPGIPIKLWAPQIALTLIESNHKKVAFLREVARVLTLTSIDIFSGRAERLSGDLGNMKPIPGNHFDVVTLRAVERFRDVLPVAAHLLARNGRLALLIGFSQVTQASSRLGTITWSPPVAIPLSESRVLLLGTYSSSSQTIKESAI